MPACEAMQNAIISEQYAAEIGADGMGANAVLAVDKAKQVMVLKL